MHASNPTPPSSREIMGRELIILLPKLRAYARFLVRDRSGADDLVQESLAKALAALPQFQPGSDLKAWVFVILRNTFYEQVRRARREKKALSQGLQSEAAEAPRQMSHGEVADLQRLLWALSPLLREAIILVGAQELSYEEAARICAIPVGTMKARVSRARAQLARAMARAEEPSKT
jgi:RNA polymerase sigma-70 factor, ECF subfamily